MFQNITNVKTLQKEDIEKIAAFTPVSNPIKFKVGIWTNHIILSICNTSGLNNWNYEPDKYAVVVGLRYVFEGLTCIYNEST